jgi:hypothetical protein
MNEITINTIMINNNENNNELKNVQNNSNDKNL